jgi:hypothetical protein
VTDVNLVRSLYRLPCTHAHSQAFVADPRPNDRVDSLASSPSRPRRWLTRHMHSACWSSLGLPIGSSLPRSSALAFRPKRFSAELSSSYPTPSSLNLISYLVDIGVDGFITDYPAAVRAWAELERPELMLAPKADEARVLGCLAKHNRLVGQ